MFTENTQNDNSTTQTKQLCHDIKSPLASIQAALEYFNSIGKDDNDFQNFVRLLELSTKRLSAISTDFLQDNQAKVSQNTSFSAHNILDELIEEFSKNPMFENVLFAKKYETQNLLVRGDSAQLQRAFSNIIKNALEAMQFSGILKVSTQTINQQLTISIEDNGKGMSKSSLSKILGGGYTEGKFDGHGIGMTVVNEVVKNFNGKLTAKSYLGKGTKFSIIIPLHDDHHENKKSQNTNNKYDCVLIDDDELIRTTWAIEAKNHGEKLNSFSTAQDFFNSLSKYDKKTKIYIDSNLADNVKGEDIAQVIYQNGFENIYLTTGYDRSYFTTMPWIKDILGKHSPFGKNKEAPSY